MSPFNGLSLPDQGRGEAGREEAEHQTVGMTMSTMPTFGDLLQGYALPQLLPLMPDGQGGYEKLKPFGNTGLSARVAQIVFLWEASATFRRRRFLMFGHLNMSPLFHTLASALEQGWLVEVLRVMDKPSFGTRTKARDNLTVAKCHDLFQADPTPTAAQKANEQTKFAAVTDRYDKANLQVIRNRDMFHLDLIDNQQPPRPTGDVEKLTQQLTEWFLTVAPLHYRRSLDVTFHMRTVRNREGCWAGITGG
jgi:hypothetical protein